MEKRKTKCILGILVIIILVLCILLPRCKEKKETQPIPKADTAQPAEPKAPVKLPEDVSQKESLKNDARKAMQSLGSGMDKLRDGVVEKTKLTEEDVQRYIRVYKRLAEISPQLEKSKTQSKSSSIYACKECRSLLDKTVKDEGYSNFTTFLMMDMRMHYTMQAVATIKMTEILGGAASGISVDELIAKPEKINELNEKDQTDISRLLHQASALKIHIKRMGEKFQKWAGIALDKGDLALVSKHYDEIFSAWENSELPSELKHTGGSHDWDD